MSLINYFRADKWQFGTVSNTNITEDNFIEGQSEKELREINQN